ncbi:hypothetical protein KSZ_45740 [Dictyobacter formicarum]|uniref:Gfo/Idh/MocA-like oxidoreductase N-terminal domain-containing protein n=1 Tax=Dictyobacter formicarum TaxID=2778368 RepID=A0ABQ3VMH3_9CHLR|nr:hypothetical protein KSZ_45740 [Dictyobacter formicarum]
MRPCLFMGKGALSRAFEKHAVRAFGAQKDLEWVAKCAERTSQPTLKKVAGAYAPAHKGR